MKMKILVIILIVGGIFEIFVYAPPIIARWREEKTHRRWEEERKFCDSNPEKCKVYEPVDYFYYNSIGSGSK